MCMAGVLLNHFQASTTFTVGSAGSGGATIMYGTVKIGDDGNGESTSLTLYGDPRTTTASPRTPPKLTLIEQCLKPSPIKIGVESVRAGEPHEGRGLVVPAPEATSLLLTILVLPIVVVIIIQLMIIQS